MSVYVLQLVDRWSYVMESQLPVYAAKACCSFGVRSSANESIRSSSTPPAPTSSCSCEMAAMSSSSSSQSVEFAGM